MIFCFALVFKKLIPIQKMKKFYLFISRREILVAHLCTTMSKLGSCPGALNVRVLDILGCTREYPPYGVG